MSSQLNGEYNIRIGDSIKTKANSNLLTFRYDFIPESGQNKSAGEVNIQNDDTVTVKYPKVNSSEFTQYKGTLTESNKEYVIIYNKKTKEMVLERIDYVVNLKNIRDKTQKATLNIKTKETNLVCGSHEEETNKRLASVKQDVNKKLPSNATKASFNTAKPTPQQSSFYDFFGGIPEELSRQNNQQKSQLQSSTSKSRT